MSLRIIAAMSNNWVIGSEGAIPWDCSEDRVYFQDTTKNHDLIVGRKTYATCSHLPRLIVLSQNKLKVRDLERKDTRLARNVDEALAICSPDVYVIGGAQIYRLFLPLAQKLILSQIDVTVAGDAFFPDFGHRQWTRTSNWKMGICHFHIFEKVQNTKL